MARQVDLEPIQVNFGEEFQPFLGMNKLRPGGSPDVIGYSRLFNLKEIGQGTIILGDILNLEHDFKGNVLVMLENNPQLVKLKKYLRSCLSTITVDIYPFLSHIKTQPDIKCIVRAGVIEQIANNANFDDSVEESALFYSFALFGRSKAQDLLVPPKLSFLKDLYFRFEPK